MSVAAEQNGGPGDVSWEDFVAVIAEIAEADCDDVRPHVRLVEDLNLDSLALLEVIVGLVVDLGLEELSDEMQASTWRGVTVGDLYKEYVQRAPSAWKLQWQ
jgi:acyl carrier protein